MSNKIEEMHLKRKASKQLVGSICEPLKMSELDEIETWLRDQRRATQPDEKIWDLLWNQRVPFFALELETLIGQDVHSNIRYGADPVQDARGLGEWDQISSSLQVLIGLIGPGQIELYDAKWPVLISIRNPLESWHIKPEEKKLGESNESEDETLSLLAFLDKGDVLNVLIRVWVGGRQPKADLARERLCDLLGKCVSDARAKLASAP